MTMLPGLAFRTAVSTRACVYVSNSAVNSNGDPVEEQACCDRDTGAQSFHTGFTAGMALAAGRLFVATSNLANSTTGNFHPGTILIYDFDGSATPPEIAPHSENPIVLTTGYNPTGVASYRTRTDRELIFVTQSGALTIGVGASHILTESFIDVIDAESVRLVATIPMGLAGLSFDAVALDPTKRIGLIGSWTLRVLYGIDLRTFDDESLYEREDLVRLDGSDTQFPDVRIFDAASPFALPDRADGPHPILCEGWTHVDINEAGESAYGLDRCDGTLTSIDLLDPLEACGASDPDPPECCDRVPLPASCFAVARVKHVTEPSNTPVFDEPHLPSQIHVRRGEPGIDYSGPDVFYLVDLPSGYLCGVPIDSQTPSP